MLLETFLYRSSGCNAIHLLAASVKVTFLDRSVGVQRWKSLSFASRPVSFSPGCLQKPRSPSHAPRPSSLLIHFYSCSEFLQRSHRLQSHICSIFHSNLALKLRADSFSFIQIVPAFIWSK